MQTATRARDRAPAPAEPEGERGALAHRHPGEYLGDLWRVSTFALATLLGLTCFAAVAAAAPDSALPPAVILGPAGIGLILLLLPDLQLYRAAPTSRRAAPPCVALRTAILLSVLAGAGLLLSQLEPLRPLRRLLPVLCASCGLIVALAHLALHARHFGRVRSLAIGLLGAGFGIYIGFVLWADTYHSLAFSRLVLGGVPHSDTLFHAAVANLSLTYLFPTVGLDGALLLNYHTGSHVLLAGLASLARVDVLDFYAVGYGIACIPLFFKALLLAALDLAKSRSWSWDGIAAPAVVVLLFGSLPWPWAQQPFVSESNLVALTVGLLLVSTAVHHGRERWFYGAAFGMTLLCLFSKISVGVPLAICLAYLFVRRREYERRSRALEFVTYAAVAGIVTWAFVYPTWPGGGETRTVLEVVGVVFELAPPVPVLYGSWIVVTLLRGGRWRSRERTAGGGDGGAGLRGWWELLTILGLCTLAFAVYVQHRSKSTYFLMTYLFLSLPVLLVLAEELAAGKRRGRGPAVVLALAAAFCLVTRGDTVTDYQEHTAWVEREVARAQAEPQWGARGRLLRQLEELGELSRSERRRSVVYVPRSCTAYWKLLVDSEGAYFLVQALSGMAVVGGHRTGDWIRHPGSQEYDREVPIETVAGALAAAGRLGYETLYVVEPTRDGPAVAKLDV